MNSSDNACSDSGVESGVCPGEGTGDWIAGDGEADGDGETRGDGAVIRAEVGDAAADGVTAGATGCLFSASERKKTAASKPAPGSHRLLYQGLCD